MNRLAAATLIAAGTLVSPGADMPEFPFVFARGYAEVELQPDTATVSFNVKAFDKEAAKAVATVEDCSRQLLALFANQSIKKDDVTAFQVDKNAVREQKDYQGLAILGYNVSRQFSVTLRDLSTYDAFIKALLAMDSVVEPYAQFDRTDREKVETDLVAKASAKAREKAEMLAKGFSAKLGPVQAISQTDLQNLGAEFGIGNAPFGGSAAMAGGEGPERTLFLPSTIKLQTEVTAIFRIQPK